MSFVFSSYCTDGQLVPSVFTPHHESLALVAFLVDSVSGRIVSTTNATTAKVRAVLP